MDPEKSDDWRSARPEVGQALRQRILQFFFEKIRSHDTGSDDAEVEKAFEKGMAFEILHWTDANNWEEYLAACAVNWEMMNDPKHSIWAKLEGHVTLDESMKWLAQLAEVRRCEHVDGLDQEGASQAPQQGDAPLTSVATPSAANASPGPPEASQPASKAQKQTATPSSKAVGSSSNQKETAEDLLPMDIVAPRKSRSRRSGANTNMSPAGIQQSEILIGLPQDSSQSEQQASMLAQKAQAHNEMKTPPQTRIEAIAQVPKQVQVQIQAQASAQEQTQAQAKGEHPPTQAKTCSQGQDQPGSSYSGSTAQSQKPSAAQTLQVPGPDVSDEEATRRAEDFFHKFVA